VAHEYVEGMWYFPMVRMLAPGNSPAFRMFATGGKLHFSDAVGSIANPIDCIKVGAVDLVDYAGRPALAGYSSMGGGIFNLTLDICGPTGCTTGTYGPQAFSGTSAACANIAGLLALRPTDADDTVHPLDLVQKVEFDAGAIALALVEIETAPELPGRVETISPANGEIIDGNSVTLAWAPVEGAGSIGYIVEVAHDPRFGDMLMSIKTTDNTLELGSDSPELYWRVTAFNEYGAAPASEVHQLRFETLTINALLAPEQRSEGGEDAAGCAGTEGASGLTAMVVAIIASIALMRMRRKHA
jgi:hypothetical protein